MKKLFAVTIIFCAAVVFSNVFADAPTHGMVASVNPIATQAGVNALKSGGNAIKPYQGGPANKFGYIRSNVRHDVLLSGRVSRNFRISVFGG